MSASARLAAASAVAASLFALALPAVAADLYEPPRGMHGAGSPYDDPRYADSYGEEAPAFDRDAEPPEDFEPPYPPLRSFHDGERPYEPRRYSEREDGCVPRQVVRDRLLAEGWGDFREFEPRGRVVVVQARRPSGRPFDLTIDRCTGEVVEARPLYDGRSYAYGPRRFWQRPY